MARLGSLVHLEKLHSFSTAIDPFDSYISTDFYECGHNSKFQFINPTEKEVACPKICATHFQQAISETRIKVFWGRLKGHGHQCWQQKEAEVSTKKIVWYLFNVRGSIDKNQEEIWHALSNSFDGSSVRVQMNVIHTYCTIVSNMYLIIYYSVKP